MPIAARAAEAHALPFEHFLPVRRFAARKASGI
jgi:hypothetical protein